MATDIKEIFGTKVFNDKVMKERLSPETYNALRKTIEMGTPLTIEIANEIASQMKWVVNPRTDSMSRHSRQYSMTSGQHLKVR